jgi:hypothetical protein
MERTYLIWSCRENGPNATTKNYDSLETWRKETTRPFPENLERWNIYSNEWKRSKNGRMEQSKAMEYESRKASSDVLKPRDIYIYIYTHTHTHRHTQVWKANPAHQVCQHPCSHKPNNKGLLRQPDQVEESCKQSGVQVLNLVRANIHS